MSYFRSGGGIAASEQFSNYNQTDVFSVNQNGQLTVSWVTGAGEWQGPIEIGPVGLAPAGCAVAACQQFGINQTDVFLVDNHGQLNVFYLFQGGAWSGPVKIGPAGLAPAGCHLAVSQQIGINQTDVSLIGNDGQLNVFYVVQAGPWNGPVKIGPAGNAAAGAALAASQQIGVNQTDVFLIDNSGQLNIFYVYEQAAWNGPVVRGNPVAAPSSGLGSNSNYFLHANGTSLTGVVITINVSQDITGSDGFGIQLNAYSAKSDYDAAQQYLIYLSPTSSPAALTAMVDNWTASNAQIENVQQQLATLSSHTLPAGYQLVISLQNDSSGNITGARYQAFDNHGKSIGDKTIPLLSQSGITAKDEAPIVAFQINFVDYLNGGTTTLSSGAGLIGYYASTEMTVSNSVPSFVDWSYVTVEKANSVYGGLSSTPSHSFAQTFGFNASGTVIRKRAPVEHETRAVDVLEVAGQKV